LLEKPPEIWALEDKDLMVLNLRTEVLCEHHKGVSLYSSWPARKAKGGKDIAKK